MTALAQVTPNDAGAANTNVGNGQGAQFITGGCFADADCDAAIACCADNGQGLGDCSGIAAAEQNGKLGCGFSDASADATIDAAGAQVADQGF